MATPELFIDFSQPRGLSADGRCKAFAGTADGTGLGPRAWGLAAWWSACPRARRNNHPVVAVIRGSAINQDRAFDMG